MLISRNIVRSTINRSSKRTTVLSFSPVANLNRIIVGSSFTNIPLLTRSPSRTFATVHHDDDESLPTRKNSFGGKFEWDDALQFKDLLTDEEVRSLRLIWYHSTSWAFCSLTYMYWVACSQLFTLTWLNNRLQSKKQPIHFVNKNSNLKSFLPIVTKFISTTMTCERWVRWACSVLPSPSTMVVQD